MTIFYIFAGVTVSGIFYVLFLVNRDAAAGGPVSKMAPEEVIKFTNSNQQNEPATQQGAPQKKGFLGNIKLGKKKQDRQAELLSMEPVNQIQTIPIDPKQGEGFMSKMLNKFHFGKGRINPQDDIPQATKFTDMEKHLSEQYNINKNPDAAKKQESPPPVGTAGMTTSKPVEEDDDIIRINDPAFKKDEPSEPPPELENPHLIQDKYQKLDAMFKEQSEELEKTRQTLDSEMKNRNDYGKVKDILDEEIKTLKDRGRELQDSLNEARKESEEQKQYAQQLKDKIAQLEKYLPDNSTPPASSETQINDNIQANTVIPETPKMPEPPSPSNNNTGTGGTPMNVSFDPTKTNPKTETTQKTLGESISDYEENVKKSLVDTGEIQKTSEKNQTDPADSRDTADLDNGDQPDNDQLNNQPDEKKE